MEVLGIVAFAVVAVGWMFWRQGQAQDKRLAAFLRALDAGTELPLEELSGLVSETRVTFLVGLARKLVLDDREADAVPVVRAMARYDVLEAARRATGLVGEGHGYEVLGPIVDQALATWPRQAALRAEWARALLAVDRPDEALAAIDAAPLADPELEMVRALVLGEETVDADDGLLAAHSWENHLLCGRTLRDEAPGPAGPLARIAHPHQDHPRLLARAEARPTDPVALAEVGLAELRMGDPDRALPWLRRAVEADASLFVAHLALAEALLALETRTVPRARSLPEVLQAPPWADRFPDWEALTELEQRMVAASVAPLARWVPSLPELRLAPLVARPGDVDAVCFVHDLWCLHFRHGWALADGLARRVYDVLDDADGLVVLAALEEVPPGEGELSDPAAFFAEMVVRWLNARHFPDDDRLGVPEVLSSLLGA